MPFLFSMKSCDLWMLVKQNPDRKEKVYEATKTTIQSCAKLFWEKLRNQS